MTSRQHLIEFKLNDGEMPINLGWKCGWGENGYFNFSEWEELGGVLFIFCFSPCV